MATEDGALKLPGNCAEVPVKSISADLAAWFTRTATLITAPLSVSYRHWPSRSAPITRRTASSALSCTCRMYACTTSRPKCSTIRRSSDTPRSLAAICARRSARFTSGLRDG